MFQQTKISKFVAKTVDIETDKGEHLVTVLILITRFLNCTFLGCGLIVTKLGLELVVLVKQFACLKLKC